MGLFGGDELVAVDFSGEGAGDGEGDKGELGADELEVDVRDEDAVHEAGEAGADRDEAGNDEEPDARHERSAETIVAGLGEALELVLVECLGARATGTGIRGRSNVSVFRETAAFGCVRCRFSLA